MFRRQYAISISARRRGYFHKTGEPGVAKFTHDHVDYKSLAVLSLKSIEFIKSEHAYLIFFLTGSLDLSPRASTRIVLRTSFVVWYCRSINDRRSLSYQTLMEIP